MARIGIGQPTMRWRVLFFISLVVNLTLAGIWLVSTRRQAVSHGDSAEFGRSAAAVKTNVVVRRQFFTWSQVESDDYQKFIANLREIGYRIAMDDMGAGHAGLATFAQLEPDVVKIDMALVRGSDRRSGRAPA